MTKMQKWSQELDGGKNINFFRKEVLIMSEQFENINRELKIAWDISSEPCLSEPYLGEIESNLGKFHRGLVVFARVHAQIYNGGFEQVFSNGYISAFKETIFFLNGIRNEPEIEQFTDKIVPIFEEAIKVQDDYEDAITMIRPYSESDFNEECEYDEWHYHKEQDIGLEYLLIFHPLDIKYFEIVNIFLDRLDLLVKNYVIQENL